MGKCRREVRGKKYRIPSPETAPDRFLGMPTSPCIEYRFDPTSNGIYSLYADSGRVAWQHGQEVTLSPWAQCTRWSINTWQFISDDNSTISWPIWTSVLDSIRKAPTRCQVLPPGEWLIKFHRRQIRRDEQTDRPTDSIIA